MKKYKYASGFKVGDRFRLVPGPRTYNTHIHLKVGDTGRVVEPAIKDITKWPIHLVEVEMDDGGMGALDACILEKWEPLGVNQTYLK